MSIASIATTPLDRTAWLEWRNKGIGASDVAGILGISPWQSPFSVWADKTGIMPPEPDNETFEFGRWAELMLGPWFEHRTGLHLIGQQARVERSDLPHHRSTLDGIIVPELACTHGGDCRVPGHPDGLHGMIPEPILLDQALGTSEIKTDFAGKPWKVIPAHYQTQGQWQLHVTGLQQVWFVVLHGRRMRTYTLPRDQDDIDFMVAKVDRFWTEHVLANEPPEVDSSEATRRALAAIYPVDDRGASVELTSKQAAAIDDYQQAKADEKAAKARARGAGNVLRAAAGDAYELTYNGTKVATYGSQTRTTVCEHCGVTDVSEPFRVLRPSKKKETTE